MSGEALERMYADGLISPRNTAEPSIARPIISLELQVVVVETRDGGRAVTLSVGTQVPLNSQVGLSQWRVTGFDTEAGQVMLQGVDGITTDSWDAEIPVTPAHQKTIERDLAARLVVEDLST